MDADNKKRNEEIFKLLKAGNKISSVANLYRISATRVRQIQAGERRRESYLFFCAGDLGDKAWMEFSRWPLSNILKMIDVLDNIR